ncbi:glycosyltransferase family 4 protein [Thomasclavelia cocleata]|uniref:glycosyltransferase family 4 protein n=1 Tax=Thomasclavelia cocleata TaxID=69824 RepID=UPI002431573A|nr:glycosyltransferase family 4 protein [Thomasclavelia cocleata]
MKKNKIIVAHPGQQHSYQTAIGLKQNNQLYKYITTVYNKKNSLTNFICKFLPGNIKKRALNRRCQNLDDDNVLQICELDGLILLFLQRIDKRKKIYDKWSLYITKKFGIKVAKYAIKNQVDAVIIYDTQGVYIGRYLKKVNSEIKLIMDISAANLDYMKKIYAKDFEINPNFKEKLFFERGYLWDDKMMNPLREELLYPRAFLAGSIFVKESLKYAGVDENKIYVCPYGSNFPIKKGKEFFNYTPLKLIYVGNVTAMKGIYYLLEAIMRFDKNEVSLVLVGNYDNSKGEFNKYLSHTNFIGAVPHFEVEDYLSKAEVFIMPSLGEGFNLSIVEALSLGLPCIVSKNTGVSDFIIDKENGLLFDIQNIDEITYCIQWILDNRDLLPEMSKKALQTAKILTWDNYYKNLSKIIVDVLG